MNFSTVLYDTYRKLIRESKYRWLIIIASALYLITPFNLATDLVPIIGWIDDGVILTLLMTELSAILLERIKAKQDVPAATVAADGTTNATTNTTNTNPTVDVDSVQVK
jgi:uncharacterized membrane protein YkvA (DUF1232 family)